jgi:SAM-dependent methyltransferase
VIAPARPTPLALVFEDLSIRPDRVRTVGETPAPPNSGQRSAVGAVPLAERDLARAGAELVAFGETQVSEDGALLVLLDGGRGDADLAALRNALWPFVHVVALYRMSHGGIERATLEGSERLRGGTGIHGTLLVGRRRAAVLAPGATVAKFDKNATSWDGKPGTPGYAHFRWMRKYVGTFAPETWLRSSVGRILDFGCGAGWVGIEAALAAGASKVELCAFDPSPEMVKLAEENARASGIAKLTARTGFGDDPPFPAPGEPPFDLVISSGVVSFAPDTGRFLDGLARTVAPGGKLVVGDIHRESKGMRRRRATKPLLPAREMNARTRREVRAELERRGFVLEAEAGYQLTRPVPELMHWSETRLSGLLHPALLAWNRARAGAGDPDAFDSWVLRFART